MPSARLVAANRSSLCAGRRKISPRCRSLSAVGSFRTIYADLACPRCALAWERGAAVGIVGVFREDGRVYVISMWTDPGSRGRGVGRALLDAAVAFAGDVEIRLSVTETNAAARRLYERYGFAPTGHTEPLRSNPSLLVHELELRR